MKILIVSQYFAPETAPIPTTLAHELAARGHSVRVLTGYPNYPQGSLYPGYRQRWRTREQHGRVEVTRVPLYVDHSASAARRITNYSSFALSSTTAASFARGADVVYVYATQMTAALGPWLWRLTGGAPYVLHIQDLWPDSITGSSLLPRGPATSVVDALLNPWIKRVYARAACVLAIAPTMLETLRARGVREGQARLVYNWVDQEHLPKAPRRHGRHKPGRTVFGFAGNLGDMQDLATVIRAAFCAADAGAWLTFRGDGVAQRSLQQLVQHLGATNIEFLPRLPMEDMADHYDQVDFSVISLKNLPAFRGTIPSKLQASLAHGVPVVSTVPGDVADIVKSLGVGLTSPPEDPEALEETFRQACSMSDESIIQLGAAAGTAYRHEFSLEAAVDVILDSLHRASDSKKAGRHVTA